MLGGLVETGSVLPPAGTAGVGVSCDMGVSAVAADSVLMGTGVVMALGVVVWTDGSSTVPNDLLSLVWTDLACRCSSHSYSLSSARFTRAALPRRVRNLVRMVPKTLQSCLTEAELGQMERIRRANWASGVSGWFGWDIASQTSSGLSFVP